MPHRCAVGRGKIINDQTWLIRNQGALTELASPIEPNGRGKFQAYMEVELKQLKEQLALLTGASA